MRTFRFAALALTLMLPAARSAWADGPTMNPGKWETKTVQTNSLSPKEHVKTITECVKENKNPLEAIAEAGKCKIANKEVKGQTVNWEMECGGTNKAKGKGSFTADGNSGEGMIEMTMMIADKSMTAKNMWSGKRIGDCE